MSKPLTALGLQYLTIPLQHSSVTSKESLCKHTKALFSKFLFKFAYKTASSFISSWVFGWNIKVWDRDAELRQQMQSVHLRIGSRPTSASSPHLVLRDLMMLAVICWAVVTVAPGTRYTQQLSLPASYSCITLGLTCTVSGHTGHSRSAKVDSVNVGFGDPMIPPLVGR